MESIERILYHNWVERHHIRYERRILSETLSLFHLSYYRPRTWLSLCEIEDRICIAALKRMAGSFYDRDPHAGTHTLFDDQPPYNQRWIGCSYQE